MTPIRAPRSLAAATVLAERFAAIEGAIGTIDAMRAELIARANADADKAVESLITERDALRDKLGAWWPTAAAALTKGKRKSIELGGCIIGSRSQRVSLNIAGDEAQIVAVLEKRKWAEPLLRKTTAIDRAAVLKSIDGVYAKQLAAMGFSKKEPGDLFVLERAEQGGTLAGAGA
jgi:hypothetical protein